MSSVRSGFTAIELLIVTGIMAMLSAMAAPAALTAMSKHRVRDAGASVLEAWNHAAQLAREHQRPVSGPAADHHYGVLIEQSGHDAPVVTLVYGSGPHDAQPLMRSDGATAAGPVFQHRCAGGVRAALTHHDGSVTIEDHRVLWFAQYRTGLPLAPDQLAAPDAIPTAVGVDLSAAGLPPSVSGVGSLTRELRFETLGYDRAAGHGHAVGTAIYHAGIAVLEER